MSLPFSPQIKEIADDMGVSLFQRFSFVETSKFLNCSETELQDLIDQQKIDCIVISETNTQFFGHQLVNYLLDSSTSHATTTQQTAQPDRIIRANEVQEMTGLSRTSIWRYEKENTFPNRVKLGDISVGWKLSEVQEWIQQI